MELLTGFLFGVGVALGLIIAWMLLFAVVMLIDKFK